MADTTTLNETLKSPIDGTENVRLATAGLNWRSPLSTIFSTLGREKLTADRDYYVRTDGSDSNNGLTNTAGGAFLTIQKAVNTARSIDPSIYNVRINIGAGTFDQQTTISGGLISGLPLYFIGADSAGSTVLDYTTVGSGFPFFVTDGGNINVSNVKIQNTAGNASMSGLQVDLGGTATVGSGVIFGSVLGSFSAHMQSLGVLILETPYSVTAAAETHIFTSFPGYIQQFSGVATLSGAQAYGYAFFRSDSGFYWGTAGFTGGTITGTRYIITGGGIANTFGSGVNYFPGDVPGTGGLTTGGGYYL